MESKERDTQAARAESDRREWVSKMFGSEFSEATLSALEVDAETMSKLHGWVKKPKGFLVYLASPGFGKTYFCAAVMNYFYYDLVARHIQNRGWRETDFFSDIRAYMDEKGDYLQKMRDKCSHGLIILDDLGSSGMTKWQKDVLFDFLDLRHSNGLPTVLTSNLSKREFQENFDARFCSRLFDTRNTVIETTGADKRLKEKDNHLAGGQ